MRGRMAILAVCLLTLHIGCEKKDSSIAELSAKAATQSNPAPLAPDRNTPGSTSSSITQAQHVAGSEATAPMVDAWHQPFAEAIRLESLPRQLPPLRTKAGLSVGKVYSQVQAQWQQIRFRSAQGQPIRYKATLTTGAGPVEIELLSDVAPNHCRNFIALSRSGFYDGLAFETRIGEPQDPSSPKVIAAGSIEGNGNDAAHLGYCLKHEILTDEEAHKRGLRHRRGMIGAIHLPGQPDTACCRFYVCLTDAPALDGQFTLFARVTKGLEILDQLYATEVQDAVVPPPLFVQPLTIQKVAIDPPEQP